MEDARDEAVSMSLEGTAPSGDESPMMSRQEPPTCLPIDGETPSNTAGTAVLQEVMAFYIKLCYDTGRGWASAQTPMSPTQVRYNLGIDIFSGVALNRQMPKAARSILLIPDARGPVLEAQ